MSDLLSIDGLRTHFDTDRGVVRAVDGIDLTVESGETVGLVGESGSGKSVTALSLVDLVESPGRVTDGAVRFRDPDLAEEFPDAAEGEMVDLAHVERFLVAGQDCCSSHPLGRRGRTG